jgi:hypothetical protein
MTRRINNIQPGVIANENEMVKSLRERGFYRSGIPRDREAAPKVRRLSRAQLRSLGEEDFQLYINAMRDTERRTK